MCVCECECVCVCVQFCEVKALYRIEESFPFHREEMKGIRKVLASLIFSHLNETVVELEVALSEQNNQYFKTRLRLQFNLNKC